jgi:hypothetical protein
VYRLSDPFVLRILKRPTKSVDQALFSRAGFPKVPKKEAGGSGVRLFEVKDVVC